MINAGQVVFSKSVRQRSGGLIIEHKCKKGIEIINLVLGAYKYEDKLPTKNETILLLGELGYFPGDTIAEVFGEKGFQKLTKAFLKEFDK